MESSARQLTLPEIAPDHAATAQEQAYRRLRNAIMVGAIAPGRPVTIRGLAAALSLSPTPVREALRRLSSENALQTLENRRIIVPRMPARRFEELIAARSALEQHAIERATPFVDTALIETLQELDSALDAALARRDFEAGVTLNQRFHALIYRANPDAVTLPMIESVWLQLGPFLGVAARHIGVLYPVDRHAEILSALRRRDPLAAAAAVDADIRDGVGRLGRRALRTILSADPDPEPAGPIDKMISH